MKISDTSCCVFILFSFGLVYLAFRDSLITSQVSIKSTDLTPFYAAENLPVENKLLPIMPKSTVNKSRFIANFIHDCAGIGNWLFRFAGCYGIGLKFDRLPYFDLRNGCAEKLLKEIHDTFPATRNVLSGILAPENETRRTDYALMAFKFDDFSIMHDAPEKYLLINGRFLQTYKYFHFARSSIRKLLEFGEETKKRIDGYATGIFRNEITSTHKLCVHTRVGDFKKHESLESRVEFIVPAMEYMRSMINTTKPFSAVILGDTPDFIKSIPINLTTFQQRYYPSFKERTDDIYFATKYCDSFLMSASASTFAWWMAYLLPEEVPVFYNSQTSKNRRYGKDFFDYDYFPPEWTRLEVNLMNNTVFVDQRWHYEKYGVHKAMFAPRFTL